jgi:hypothetical protein
MQTPATLLLAVDILENYSFFLSITYTELTEITGKDMDVNMLSQASCIKIKM